jgi:hypothetical protein
MMTEPTALTPAGGSKIVTGVWHSPATTTTFRFGKEDRRMKKAPIASIQMPATARIFSQDFIEGSPAVTGRVIELIFHELREL